MKVYFSPLACSLATRIVLHEAGADAEFIEVDGKTKRTRAGVDYRTIHPLGLVPSVEMDNGEVLAENAAVLQYVADKFPDAKLAPTDAIGRARLQQWLCFIGTELHKSIYAPLLHRQAPEEVKSYALAKTELRLGWVARSLEGRSFLLDSFSVADAYLVAVLNWSQVTPVPLEPYPAITSFLARMHDRPAVARAFEEEKTLYATELARRTRGSR